MLEKVEENRKVGKDQESWTYIQLSILEYHKGHVTYDSTYIFPPSHLWGSLLDMRTVQWRIERWVPTTVQVCVTLPLTIRIIQFSTA